MGDDDAGKPLGALSDSEIRFRAILEHAPVMIDSFDEQGTCVLWNRECERRLGWSMAEVAAMPDPLGAFYPEPAMRESVLAAIGRCDGVFRQYRVLAKDGEVRIQRWADFRLPTGAVISVGLDVTEQVTLEEQLRQAQKMDAIGLLAGGVAHDFNNLLTVILGQAELLAAAKELDPESIRQTAREIVRASRRGSELVAQLMAFSRKGSMEMESVELGPALTRLGATLRRLLPETIDLEVDVEDGLPSSQANVGAVEQAVINLVNNARDAIADRGRIALRVHRAPGKDDAPQVAISVKDDGRGLSAEAAERVFEPFFTTKAPGEGTGLGLTMVYGMAERHGGSVVFDSALGRGTQVTITLPAVSPAGSLPTAGPSRPTPVRGKGRILVVEDQVAVRRVLVKALTELGYSVRAAADGAEAVDQLSSASFDLVLSDVDMPRMGGGELRAYLGEHHPGTGFAFTTGYATKAGPEETAGAPLLPKPWSLDTLASFVADCMASSE